MGKSLLHVAGTTLLSASLAYRGAAGKMNGHNMKPWGHITNPIILHIIPFFSQERYLHAAVVLQKYTIIIAGGEGSSKYTGEIVKSKFASWYMIYNGRSIGHLNFHSANDNWKWLFITGGKKLTLISSGYQSCAVVYNQNEFVLIGGKVDGGAHGKVDRYSSSLSLLFSSPLYPRYDSEGKYLGSLPDLATPRRHHSCTTFLTSNGDQVTISIWCLFKCISISSTYPVRKSVDLSLRLTNFHKGIAQRQTPTKYDGQPWS